MQNKTYLDPTTRQPQVERRSGIDRRGPLKFTEILTNTYRRRRSRGRRRTDKAAYIDLYDSRSWGIAIAVLILSLIDALLTAFHITKNTAWEMNPIMSAIINYGGLPAFFGAKAVMTIIPMAVILIHKEWRLGKYAARIILISYVLLTMYHLFLLYGVRNFADFVLAAP
jgi:hypothetical protein